MNNYNSNTASDRAGAESPSIEPRTESGIPDSDPIRVCVDCGAPAPKTESAYTLISALHGWRLTREIDAEGRRTIEWRCPVCWAELKARTR